jgi:hypothetical protein
MSLKIIIIGLFVKKKKKSSSKISYFYCGSCIRVLLFINAGLGSQILLFYCRSIKDPDTDPVSGMFNIHALKRTALTVHHMRLHKL